ncbi:MAG: DUF2207 domain-containing protein, partial [Clostridia bacterium]|nr:DUF2207 domain-containing protein [Clostridia bacterium]
MKGIGQKKRILILTLCALLVLAVALFLSAFFTHKDGASITARANIKDTNVEYKSVEKIIKIDEKKSCDITEIITVGFRKSGINVGLSRNVSRVNKITRIVNGKKYVNKTVNSLQLYSVTLNGEEEYSFVEEYGDYFYINTGADGDYKQADIYVYEIHYRYDMSDDMISDFDDFTFDIMDYGFRGAVEKFSATVTMPKDFLGGNKIEDVLTFRTNDMAPLDYDAVNAQFDAQNLTIRCSYGRLEQEHGLTMQLILPQGYFANKYKPSSLYWVTLGVAVGAVIVIVLIIVTSRFVFGNTAVTTEYYPPEGYSPLDVGRSYRGRIRGKDFAALVISWANKGLVSIELKGKNRIILRRLKDYDIDAVTDYSEHEKDFFNSLFGFADVYDTKSKQSITGGADKLDDAVKALHKLKPEQTITLIIKRIAIVLISIIPFALCYIWICSIMGGSPGFLVMLVLPIIAITVFVYVPMPIWFKLIWCSFFGAIPFIIILCTATYSVYDIYGLFYITAAILVLGMASSAFVRAFGNKEKLARGRVLGFKKFLVLAELDKLNALLEENPEYFYDILPYCYVFGITKKMEKKFVALHAKLPEYFSGVSMSELGHNVSSSMRHVCGGYHSRGGGGGSGGGGGGG